MLEPDKKELAVRLRNALKTADRLELWDVGASINRALVILTGQGLTPAAFPACPERIA